MSNRPADLDRFIAATAIALSLLVVALMLLLPAESLVVDLVYQGF